MVHKKMKFTLFSTRYLHTILHLYLGKAKTELKDNNTVILGKISVGIADKLIQSRVDLANENQSPYHKLHKNIQKLGTDLAKLKVNNHL